MIRNTEGDLEMVHFGFHKLVYVIMQINQLFNENVFLPELQIIWMKESTFQTI